MVGTRRQLIQQWVFYARTLAVLLKQIVEGFDGQRV
jgi:hypothetical protein